MIKHISRFIPALLYLAIALAEHPYLEMVV
jgi:hypothetical protein